MKPNRFSTRLLLAIVGTALLSLLAVPITNLTAMAWTFRELPQPFRERVIERGGSQFPDAAVGALRELRTWFALSLFDAGTDPASGPSYGLGTAGVVPRELALDARTTLPVETRAPGDRGTVPANPARPSPGVAHDPVMELFDAAPFGVDPMVAAALDRENDRLFALVARIRASLQVATFTGVGAALVLSVALALVLARSIARPLERVSQAASTMAEGDLSVRVAPEFAAHPQGIAGLHWQRPLEMRNLAERFDAMAERVQRSERERQAMIADIAHELRTPLATLQMRLDALGAGVVPLEQREVALLQGQVALLSRLVRDLRLLSLAETGALSIEPQPVDLGAWLAEQLELRRPEAEAAGVRLEFRCDDAPLVASIDPERFEQVLTNLLSNALRATPRGGWIRVEAVPEPPDRVALRVADSGPGIPPDVLPDVFDRFVRGSGERRDVSVAGGSGLGLAIVRALAERHGGSAGAENLATGARFTVSVPVARAPAPRATMARASRRRGERDPVGV